MHDACQLRLRVRGVEYGDIISATWTRGLEQVVDTASLEVSEKWMQPGKREAFPFRKFAPAEFVVDGTVVLTGFVKAMPRGYGESGPRNFKVELVSKAWRAVRCSYAGKSRTWRDVPIMRIATDVFGSFEDDPIKVTTRLVDIGETFSRHGAQVGESAWSVLHRALKARGLWCVSKPDGNVEIVEAGSLPYVTPVVGPGVPGMRPNAKAGQFDDSGEELFSDYIVVGQAGKRADWFGAQAAHGWALAHDPSVELYGPLILFESSISKQRELEHRADWEMKTRAARARRIPYTVQGAYWDGALIETNRRIAVIDPGLDTEGEFLIANATTTFGGGTSTAIDVMPPQAFLRESAPPKKGTAPRDQDGKFVAYD